MARVSGGTGYLPVGGRAFGQRLLNSVKVEQQLAADLQTGDAAGESLIVEPVSRQAKPSG
jgi:hypothetical protein